MIKLKFRLLSENKSLYIIMFLMSIFLAAIFGDAFAGGGKPVISVSDELNNFQSAKLIESLKKDTNFEIKLQTLSEGIKTVEDRESLLLLNIGDKIQLFKLKDSMEGYQVEEVVKNFLRNENQMDSYSKEFYRILEKERKSEINYEELKKDIEKSVYENSKDKNIFFINAFNYSDGGFSNYNSKIHYTVGMTIFFVTYSLMFTVGDFLEDRRLHTLDRMMVSPVSNMELFLGNIIPAFTVGIVQGILMILSGKFLFAINWGEHYIKILVIFAIYIFAMTALSFFIVTRVKTMSGLSAIAPIILTGMGMIGGCMWPLEIINSKILLFMANLTPHKWALESIKSLIITGEIEIKSVLILLFMGILFFIGGTNIYKKNIN